MTIINGVATLALGLSFCIVGPNVSHAVTLQANGQTYSVNNLTEMADVDLTNKKIDLKPAIVTENPDTGELNFSKGNMSVSITNHGAAAGLAVHLWPNTSNALSLEETFHAGRHGHIAYVIQDSPTRNIYKRFNVDGGKTTVGARLRGCSKFGDDNIQKRFEFKFISQVPQTSTYLVQWIPENSYEYDPHIIGWKEDTPEHEKQKDDVVVKDVNENWYWYLTIL